jgi:hypothetical protein
LTGRPLHISVESQFATSVNVATAAIVRTKERKQVMRTRAIENRIEAVIAHWEELPSLAHGIREFVPSIECDHIDTVCLSCASPEELERMR